MQSRITNKDRQANSIYHDAHYIYQKDGKDGLASFYQSDLKNHDLATLKNTLAVIIGLRAALVSEIIDKQSCVAFPGSLDDESGFNAAVQEKQEIEMEATPKLQEFDEHIKHLTALIKPLLTDQQQQSNLKMYSRN